MSKNELEKCKYKWLNDNTNYGSSNHGKKYLPLIKKIIKNNNCSSLLDVGTGQGQFCEEIKDCCNEVIGLDWCIEPAKHINHENITFLSSDAINIPLENKSVDITTSFDFFEHVIPEHVELVIKEMVRVTKKLFIHNINYNTPSTSKRDTLERLFNDGELHQTRQNSKWWFELFAKYGDVLRAPNGLLIVLL